MTSYDENISHQLKMLDATWEKFVEYGVTAETELILDFSYIAPNKESANSLSTTLEDYDTSIRSEGFLKKNWYVEGQTHSTTVTKEKLAQWLNFLVAKGWEFNCEFDGFGASMPEGC